MRTWWMTCAIVLAAGSLPAQGAPGFVELSFAGLGGQTTVSGESRLPVRAHEATFDAGTLRVHAFGVRGSVREVTVVVPQATAGQRVAVGDGATMEFAFASGTTMSPSARRGWVEVSELDADHAVGAFDATLSQGRIPLTIHGRFEVRLGR